MDDLDCIETPEFVARRMEECDRALAEELGLTYDPKTTHLELVRLASERDFNETKVAHDWFAAYAAWLDWFGSDKDKKRSFDN